MQFDHKRARKNRARLKISCAFARYAQTPRAQEILISSKHFEFRKHARDVTRCTEAKTFLRATHSRLIRERVPIARRIHVSLSGHCFFCCAVVNRNAVRVDSRRALMRHPPCYMARRAAMAKRRKKAAVKKTKKRKKKL
jgi:hypothetical protein